jgi:hypothetical protein
LDLNDPRVVARYSVIVQTNGCIRSPTDNDPGPIYAEHLAQALARQHDEVCAITTGAAPRSRRVANVGLVLVTVLVVRSRHRSPCGAIRRATDTSADTDARGAPNLNSAAAGLKSGT